MYTRRGGTWGGDAGALLFIPINTILINGGVYCRRRAQCGGVGGLRALPTFTSAASVLFNSGRAAVISPAGEQGQAWGVKEILKSTHSSHQNKSGRIKGTQKMSFFAEGGVAGGEVARDGGGEGGRGPLLSKPDRCSGRRTQERTARLRVMPH